VLIEDCCESLGATFKGQRVGTFGWASAYSFFFSHHMTTMEGGMICCQDQQQSDLFRLLRAHGWARNAKYTPVKSVDELDPRYVFMNWGFNVRPTEAQAAFGLEQLHRLPGFQAQRVVNAEYFQTGFERYSTLMRLMQVDERAQCSWFALPIVLTEDCPFGKAELLVHLEAQGIETRPIVAGNLARQPVCQVLADLKDANLPGADVVHERGFYLGLHPFDAKRQLDRLLEVFDCFIRQHS
jgi:CDP-4-dehydro-6-deoxyglucose reductase, E1